MSVVDPHDFLPHLILWNTFNTFAAVGNTTLFIVSILSRNTHNLVLLNLILAFIIVSISSSVIAWSGNALNLNPPFGICLWSGAIALSNVPLIGASALGLGLKVWASVMMTGFPAWRGVLEWASWTPLLLLLPIVSAVPVFCVSLVIGLNNRSIVYRGSPLYCIVDHSPLQNISLGLGAAYSLTCLCLTAWIVIRLLYMRWRIRRIINHVHGGISYSLILRTVVFSLFVGVAVVANMISFTSSFSAIMPDVVFSTCNVATFFIFSTTKPILTFVFRCQRMATTVPTSPTNPASSIPWRPFPADRAVSTGDPPQELITFHITDSDRKRSTVTLDSDSADLKDPESTKNTLGRKAAMPNV